MEEEDDVVPPEGKWYEVTFHVEVMDENILYKAAMARALRDDLFKIVPMLLTPDHKIHVEHCLRLLFCPEDDGDNTYVRDGCVVQFIDVNPSPILFDDEEPPPRYTDNLISFPEK